MLFFIDAKKERKIQTDIERKKKREVRSYNIYE